MVQREGRILRQGNENSSVKIYRYITKGSFDTYSWQLLETKQHFIEDLLSGCMSVRDRSDISDTALDYAEVKALAVGNPLLKERVEISNELSRYCVLQKKLTDTYASYKRELDELPTKINEISTLVPLVKADMEYYKANKRTYSEDEHKEIRHLIHEKTHGQDPSEKEESL